MLNRSFTCNIADCPSLPGCAFDVVISHVVLEHVDVRRPWEAVRTIARATRPGGLSLHVVPFSHGFERILPHLFQDSGFEVLETGYDLCELHPSKRHKRVTQYSRGRTADSIPRGLST